MGGDQPDPGNVSRHGIKATRGVLRERFAGDLVIRDAVDEALRDFQERWDISTMDPAEFERIQSVLAPHLRRLATVPVSDAKACAEAFLREWQALRNTIRWI
jgi:hypothetical protein